LARQEVFGNKSLDSHKARNMHAGRREKMIRGRGPMGKAIVFGLLDREAGRFTSGTFRRAAQVTFAARFANT